MSTWHCEGCDTAISENNPDMIVDHVRDYCDYVDGAGKPVKMTIKFSMVMHCIATVDGARLAEAASGRQPAAILGLVGDEDRDEDDELANDKDGRTAALLEFLEEIEETASGYPSGYEIHDVYPASRDQARGPQETAEEKTS